MSTAVEEVLSLWRRAERLLEALGPLDPDRERVRVMVEQLNQTYQNLTDRGSAAQGRVAEGIAVMKEAEALLVRMRPR